MRLAGRIEDRNRPVTIELDFEDPIWRVKGSFRALRQRPEVFLRRVPRDCLFFCSDFRARSCNAVRIKLRSRAGLTITPWFSSQELVLVLVFSSPVVGLPPQMSLVCIFWTQRSYLDRKLLTRSCIESGLCGPAGKRLVGVQPKKSHKAFLGVNCSALGTDTVEVSRPRR